MARSKSGPTRRRRHKKVLKQTKGYRLTYSKLYKRAHEMLLHAGEYSYIGRKQRKRQMRRLWIQRINAALSGQKTPVRYSRFIHRLKENDITLNRKMLAYFAFKQPKVFEKIVDRAQK